MNDPFTSPDAVNESFMTFGPPIPGAAASRRASGTLTSAG
jgi:hypothetical protein